MARLMDVDSTGIYRMLVTRQRPNGVQYQTAYGPHDASNVARDWGASTYSFPARQEKQRLSVETFGSLVPYLAWATIKTTYINGGEGVDWDDQES